MPNLINVIEDRTDGKNKKLPDEERRKEIECALKGGPNSGRGMEWGTVMIFSCEQDCCQTESGSGKEGWREEFVMVQWDE